MGNYSNQIILQQLFQAKLNQTAGLSAMAELYKMISVHIIPGLIPEFMR